MKLYANNNKSGTTNDEGMFNCLEYVNDAETKEERKIRYKELCNYVRRLMNIDNVIGLAPMRHKDTKEVIVFIPTFDIKATNENFYDLHCDEEGFYIEIDEKDIVEAETV